MWKHWINRNAWLEIDKFTGRVRWCYRPIYHDRVVICRMNLFSEIGERYQSQFTAWLTKKSYVVRVVAVSYHDYPNSHGDYYEILFALIPF